ncbi:hypothetical protein WN55_00584 [Dufourea novaeangliae]|uniref:Uncharacterized protein n=1 Tax=Dufourea novaeangliae TaxID=178035 RepID=A0A154NXW6_DUFNO|nr:hypothetical protein WN55_00584 [Dufourea novaeangliae]
MILDIITTRNNDSFWCMQGESWKNPVGRDKNTPTVSPACRKRRLKGDTRDVFSPLLGFNAM